MKEERSTNNIEMTGNQQAYNTDGARDGNGNFIIENGQRVYVGGTKFISIKDDYSKEFLNQEMDVKRNQQILKTMIRTDVDSHEDYKSKKLQNQVQGSNAVNYFGSSLNITSYNVYDRDGSQSDRPENVIVGVAGSDGMLPFSPDWRQNFGILNRSEYSGKMVHELKPASVFEVSAIRYEVEVREKVDELKRYRQNGIPITVVGDSKGGEDAAYLALRFVKATQPELNRIDSQDDTDYRDYSAVSIYLTNPKGIRVSDEEYHILEKMAQAGKIVKEIVYPEVVHNGLVPTDGRGLNDGRLIPVSQTIYTVPKAIGNLTENHTIGNYENDVFQGAEGKYKFQCDVEPEVITDAAVSGVMGMGSGKRVIGYCYKVTRITDKSGKTIGVNEYFFEEQKEALKRLEKEMTHQIEQLNILEREPLLDMFTSKVREKRSRMKKRHAELMMAANSAFDYAKYRKASGLDDVVLEENFMSLYAQEAEKQADSASDNYVKSVRGVVHRYIDMYLNDVHHAKRQIDGDLNMLYQGYASIDQAKETFNTSQSEIQLIIKKYY